MTRDFVFMFSLSINALITVADDVVLRTTINNWFSEEVKDYNYGKINELLLENHICCSD